VPHASIQRLRFNPALCRLASLCLELRLFWDCRNGENRVISTHMLAAMTTIKDLALA
jgi:hypothetical protein